MIPRGFLLLVLVASMLRCGHTKADSPLRVPPPTVGDAAFHHNLTLSEMDRWFGAVAALLKSHQHDSTYHLSLQFPVDSSITSQANRVNRSALAALPNALGMSAEDFVTVTAAYSAATLGKAIRDTSARHELPVNVNPRNVLFLEQNAAVLDSLKTLHGMSPPARRQEGSSESPR